METFGGSCRLCLWKGDKMIKLTGRENVISKIKLCLPIQVDMDDNLPKEICYECNYKLQIFSEFYQTCIRSDNILKRYSSQIRKTVKPEIKLETDVEVVDDNSDFTSNGSVLKLKLDAVNDNVQLLNSDIGGLGSINDGNKNKENTALNEYRNELSAKHDSTTKKVKDSGKNYSCHNKSSNCRNRTSLNVLSETVNIKDTMSKNSVLFRKTVRNNSVVESVSRTCSSKREINSLYLRDNTDMGGCELVNCRQKSPYKNPEKFLDNCDNVNCLQIPFDRGSCEIQTSTYSNISMNCCEETKESSDTSKILDSEGVNYDNDYNHKSTSTNSDNDFVSTHSDQGKERNTGLEEVTCALVDGDIEVCPSLNELIINDVMNSSKEKESKNSLKKKHCRKYYVNTRNGKKAARIRNRIKSNAKKGRRCEKMKKKKKNQNVSSIVVQKIYSCRDCNRKYSSLKWCLKHEKSHIKGRLYKCTKCNCSFISLLQLNKHDCIELFRLYIKNDHSYCSNKLENDSEMSSTTGTEKCEKCGKLFHSMVSFGEHSKNCLIKTHLMNKSNYKKKIITSKQQWRIKSYVSINMKSTLRKVSNV